MQKATIPAYLTDGEVVIHMQEQHGDEVLPPTWPYMWFLKAA